MPSSLDDASLRMPGPVRAEYFLQLPQATMERIQTLLDASVDRDRARRYFADFEARHAGALTQLVSARQRLQWLATIFDHSRFLSEELLQHPQWLDDVPDVYRVLTVADYRERLSWFLAERSANVLSALDLAQFRRREIFRVVLRDALCFASLPEITEELSNLADAILQHALDGVMAEQRLRYGKPASGPGMDPEGCGFSVLALGKLGGRELNYSSDIDLLFLYGLNGETSGPVVVTNREFFKKAANRYTDLLSTYTAEGLCYRVDLRLRPEGSLGEVCISLDGARDYYAGRARDWELQMLIKARVAAGDRSLGRALLDFVEPAIYSTSTDFSAIETMSATRERISEKLAARRLGRGGLNVKLARGGIRDIEFLVQCLQRLHGGREVWVRHGGTLLALSRLLDKDLLSSSEYSRLVTTYQFLRHLEHRLQYEDDRQTHTLPSDPDQLDRLALRMPAGLQSAVAGTPGAQLLHDLNRHLENVQVIYERIVHAQRPLSYGPTTPAEAPAPEPQRASTPAEEDEPGRHALSESILRSVAHIAPLLAETLRSRGVRRNHRALEHFFERLLEDPEWLRTLNRHATLTGFVLQMFEVSPFFSEQIIRDPSLLAEIQDVADQPQRQAAFESLAAPLNDVGALRRFFRREMLRIQTASICVPEPVFQTLDRTSALAEFVIARAYRVALERSLAHAQARATPDKPFVEPLDEMMVIALGRLGMREFDLASDADLLFIIPNTEVDRQQFWTRVAEHLIEILTAYTGEGTILSIDTRLRPNGREGSLVQTESKYTDYFANRAEAWEGIAYMKARGVAGDLDRATRFLSELQQVDWRRWGQSGRSKQDLRQMRMRLEREQGAANPLKAGRGGYYDADFALMYLRLKGAGLFFKSLNTPERIDIVEKMGHLERRDAEFLLRATRFYRALDHGLRLATGQAEGKLPESRVELDMLAELVDRWTTECPRTGGLAAEFSTLQTAMRQLFDRLFT